MPKYFPIEQFSGFRFVVGRNFMTQAAYMIVVPLFFFVFSLIYNPFDIQQYYEVAILGPSFSILMLTCIILLSLTITRTILSFVVKKMEISRWYYLAWCAAEVFVISAFMALYTVLIRQTPDDYLNTLVTCMQYCFLILVHPYLFILLVRTIMSKNEEIDILKTPRESNLMRFYDEHKRLKLTISPSSIQFVRSDFNYVIIHYFENGKAKEYQLRCSMKSIEEASDGKNLVRCHRSYFVNPEHVKVLRKDKEGFIFAELDIPELPPIPVSKSYYKSFSALL
ncbi:MAG: LytTR family transcriptional regulator [Bacteroidales bacterium]|nr:LytTR family transcriptional regulator [Bacteroidales bacterium]